MTDQDTPCITMPKFPSHGLIALNQAHSWLQDAKAIAIIVGVALEGQVLIETRREEMARLITMITSKLDDAIANIKFASEGME